MKKIEILETIALNANYFYDMADITEDEGEKEIYLAKANALADTYRECCECVDKTRFDERRK